MFIEDFEDLIGIQSKRIVQVKLEKIISVTVI